MRAGLLGVLFLAACSDAPPETLPGPPAPTRDGFLDQLPREVALTVRLPAAEVFQARPDDFGPLLSAFGLGETPRKLFYGTEAMTGIDPKRGPGFALTQGRAWVHYLPAADKAALALAMRERVASGTNYREEDDWVLLFSGGAAFRGKPQAALPTGDIALRLRHHNLLGMFASPGDTLEGALRVAGSRAAFQGRLIAGEKSTTGDVIERSVAGEGGNVEFLPAGLALRAETTLPPTFIASFFGRKLALHCGIQEPVARRSLIRLLREALTSVDTEAGFTFGIDVRGGALSFVALGQIADGSPSPLLSRILKSGSSHRLGALVIDSIEEAHGLHEYAAWFYEGEPVLEGLPDFATDAVRSLCNRDRGLELVYGAVEDRFVFAAGPRARSLARQALRRLQEGASRDGAAWELEPMRHQADEEYVLGMLVDGTAFEQLSAEDRAALKSFLGVPATATGVRVLVLAGYREKGALKLRIQIAF